MNSKEYIIYKITNILNGKVYIGQTTGTLQNRFNAHCRKDSNCIKLRNAINRYGRKNFTVEQIDVAFSKQEADNKEVKWIAEHNSAQEEYGYNITKGGNNTYSVKKVMCLETGDIFDTCIQAGKYFKCGASSISSVCNGYRSTVLNKHFVYLKDDGTPIIDNVKYVKPRYAEVICIEKGITFNSIKEASEWAKVSPSAISNNLKGKSSKAGGYRWEYVDKTWFEQKSYVPKPRKGKTPLPPKRRSNEISNKKQSIKCIETGKTYTSITEASKDIEIARSSIQIALWYPNRTAKGFHFEYIDSERKACNLKSIICVETGKVFESSTEASKFVNKDRSGIRVALREPHRTCGGYHWVKYKEVA